MPLKSFPSSFARTSKPSLFKPGKPRFWDDPHTSKSMLEAHLDQHITVQAGKSLKLKKRSAT